jgi:type II secretion system protein N
MTQRAWKNKKIIWYIFYGIVLTTGLLYYRFPSNHIRDYLQAVTARANPSLLLSIEKVRLSLPPGLELFNIELSLRERPNNIIFRSARSSIRPEFLSLVHGEHKYSLDSNAYGGEACGTLRFEGNNPKAPFAASVQMKNIHIGDCPYLSSLIGHRIGGILGGTIAYQKGSVLPIDGTGKADLRVTEGRVELSESIFGLKTISFAQLSIVIALKGQKIELDRVELKGREIQGTLYGTIGLRKEISKSTLDLKGKIEALAGIFQGIGGDINTMSILRQHLKMGGRSFIIDGTLGEPRFRLT